MADAQRVPGETVRCGGVRDRLLTEKLGEVPGAGGLRQGWDEYLGGGCRADRVACGAAVALVDLRDRLPRRRDRDAVVRALGEPGSEVPHRGDVRGLVEQDQEPWVKRAVSAGLEDRK